MVLAANTNVSEEGGLFQIGTHFQVQISHDTANVSHRPFCAHCEKSAYACMPCLTCAK